MDFELKSEWDRPIGNTSFCYLSLVLIRALTDKKGNYLYQELLKRPEG